AQESLALTTVTLANGNLHLDSTLDLISSADLGSDTGAYTWTVSGAPITAINIPFDNGALQTDFSGNNQVAALNGDAAILSSGCKVGSCLSLDGDGDYIDIVDAASLNLT